ncbi:MAG: HAD-superfamily hydrolase, subfamily IA, variant 3 [Candidatus Moranbacteria bacterium GW2011_GWC1_45_18]|nr:MAG: HAD-superfamily hydrolase, subfamily IA, variant 3 [Candidatus Moranbacteria bacterium GW2011_GWC2_40_12]KKT33616.1 MAG: HAD-superfamily hydrolase, subfamily IA, variant 3 [Candidatus Moranbacteria bacterium GW2011_GWF2_44_10]KKT72318.1 MAG: HAD-superfamily hydrolase, subfamily IA, variant 3 [Candidatus Moranbacteria bacterium GW2011_GWF1_44_4]KKT99464.1 MAG: HAD-superfamily hydrolase, subfamily IA, variant 3 [Candidatus Moranbacteria bacterium GW2011_GWC1_45_18]OGI22371.1 MAG: hypothet
MNIKTIFFDVYHTLLSVDFNGNKEAWDVFSSFLNSRGVIVDTVQFQKMFGREKQKYYSSVKDSEMKLRHHNLVNLVNAAFLNYDIKVEKKELHELIWKFRQSYHPDVNLISGVSDLLCELSLKYILATASYAQSYYTYRELEKSGIAQYFSHFIFSSDIGYRKTDQEFYKICLKKTNNAPEECLMVGDNYLQDVVTPKKVGLKAVLIRNPLTDRQNIIGDVKPDGIIRLEDIKTLPLIIQSIK